MYTVGYMEYMFYQNWVDSKKVHVATELDFSMFREEEIWRRKTLHIKKSYKKVRTLKSK